MRHNILRTATVTDEDVAPHAEARTPLETVEHQYTLDQALSFQRHILPEVSRTFALTIPQLPGDLREVVANAYLLCRIADTIEDEVALSAAEKAHFHQCFIDVIAGQLKAETLVGELAPKLSEATIPAEHQLIEKLGLVVRYTHSLHQVERDALSRCVRIMCRGMGDYQRGIGLAGLGRLRDLDHYCYFVAGVVGEMLTELFCHYLDGGGKRRAALMQLATSFGLGLQMTNILKDVWEDRARGVCWWPQDIFMEQGIDLNELERMQPSGGFRIALRKLIGVAHGHLQNALYYTQLIPRAETGIRRFCLWAIGLAVLTLQNIHHCPEYRSGQDVKVSRRKVGKVITAVRLGVRSNTLLSAMFRWASRGLPSAQINLAELPSMWSEIANREMNLETGRSQ
ncbi:MAG: phytoene/squalene synthase family protein [Wenzhouxiangellaceae bacterium]